MEQPLSGEEKQEPHVQPGIECTTECTPPRSGRPQQHAHVAFEAGQVQQTESTTKLRGICGWLCTNVPCQGPQNRLLSIHSKARQRS